MKKHAKLSTRCCERRKTHQSRILEPGGPLRILHDRGEAKPSNHCSTWGCAQQHSCLPVHSVTGRRFRENLASCLPLKVCVTGELPQLGAAQELLQKIYPRVSHGGLKCAS